MWLMYRHDMSELHSELPQPDGTFSTRRLRAAATEPGWASYLAWQQDAPVGLVLVRALDQPVHVLAEFFIVRGARGSGVAEQVVRDVLLKHSGSWDIAFQDANPRAARFWRRTAGNLVGQRWREEPRPVPGKPDSPPDIWILLSTNNLGRR